MPSCFDKSLMALPAPISTAECRQCACWASSAFLSSTLKCGRSICIKSSLSHAANLCRAVKPNASRPDGLQEPSCRALATASGSAGYSTSLLNAGLLSRGLVSGLTRAGACTNTLRSFTPCAAASQSTCLPRTFCRSSACRSSATTPSYDPISLSSASGTVVTSDNISTTAASPFCLATCKAVRRQASCSSGDARSWSKA
mmetsp:Transcript_29818/g.69342  ORF Transcript_29818/g.69342 Transcript_29818/m.69342 type:complete len:200 (+) Transcript_29818:219-818(+)